MSEMVRKNDIAISTNYNSVTSLVIAASKKQFAKLIEHIERVAPFASIR